MVFRVQKNKDYTVMSNAHLRDIRLTLKAKGLLSLMLSLPDKWDYSLKGLSNICREKVDAIREAVKELESAGYVVRSRERDGNGRLLGARYDVIESPKQPILDFPILDNPTQEKPTQEKPTQEKPTQLNTNELNTNPSNTKEKTTTTTYCAREETESEINPPTFTRIYLYFKNELCVDDAQNEAAKFEAYNAMHGWECLPSWEKAADLWAARIADHTRTG